MANLTRLLGALDHQDVDTVVQELKSIISLEVELVKVNQTTNVYFFFPPWNNSVSARRFFADKVSMKSHL